MRTTEHLTTYPKALPDHLRAIRKAQGWTQTDLANHVGVNRYTVNDWEQGRHMPRAATLGILAQLPLPVIPAPLPDPIFFRRAQVRPLRRRLGMSQSELATALGVSRATVANWEHQRTMPSPANNRRLLELRSLDKQPQER